MPRSRFDHRFQAEVERLYRAWPWDVIQSFHGNAQLANLIQWNTRKLPLVGYRAYIGHLKFRENPSTYWSVRNPNLAAVAAVSGAVKEYLEGFRILRPQNVHVISHGINRAWVDEQKTDRHDLRASLGLPNDAFIVLSMASLRPYKHFEVVVNAAKMLEGYPIHFVHAGNAKQWVDKASANIHFLGHQSKPFPILAATDIFASTSHNEAFGRSNLEAMACGKPLIGSRTGGLLDLIEDGVNGRFFESCDARDFADKVLFYYRDREAVKAHGAASIERVAEAVRDRGDGAAIRRPLSVGALSSAPPNLVGKTARHATRRAAGRGNGALTKNACASRRRSAQARACARGLGPLVGRQREHPHAFALESPGGRTRREITRPIRDLFRRRRALR